MRNAQRSNPLISLNQRVPFVCFDCQIARKTWIPFYFDEYRPFPQRKDRPLTWKNIMCHKCKRPMAYLGRYFKIPRKNDQKQWRKIEMLWRKGWAADGYGLVRGLKSPRDARDLDIEENAVSVQRKKAQKRAAQLEKLRQNRIGRQNKTIR